jgi:hypothetical protein
MNRTSKGLWCAAAFVLSGGLLWAGYQALTPQPVTLSAWAPQGSLLVIEAKDFSGLLKDWSSSAEQHAWLASDNYAGFSRSRLFSRLAEAQQQFAVSAGLPPGWTFLNQVAGNESLFAWYDIGNLEFLYITHLPAGTAEQSQLVQQKSKFEVRKAAGETFYVRSQGDPRRTVAFATHGEYLLLATREDLIANALLLMQSHGDIDLRNEHWYTSAVSAANRPAGDLRMTLNLAALVPSPYFRSYWVQGNISEMKQYSVAITDLYRGSDAFREERILLPKDSESLVQATDVAPVLEYLPASAGVYRVSAHPGTDQLVNALMEKLLFHEISGYVDARSAPAADLSQQAVGNASDLETRIDAAPLPQQPLTVALTPLHTLLAAEDVDAMLVASSTGDAPDHVFLPIYSTIVLSGAGTWNAEALRSALTSALRSRVSTEDYGLRWQRRQRDNLVWFELEGLHPLAFAVQGNVCILASDSDTLLKSLRVPSKAKPQLATVIAGFNHTAERPHFAQLTRLLGHQTATSPQAAASDATPEPPENGTQPDFFSGNILSLSDTFQALDSETFLEQPDPGSHGIRQTVVYQWKH